MKPLILHLVLFNQPIERQVLLFDQMHINKIRIEIVKKVRWIAVHTKEYNRKDRKLYFDLLKIIACFLVIVNHTSDVFSNYSTAFSKTWITSAAIFYFSKVAVPIFISGALCLSKVEAFNYSLFKFKKIFFVLVGWSFFYWLQKPEPFTYLFNFFTLFFTDTVSTHLWYLYMLLGFYF